MLPGFCDAPKSLAFWMFTHPVVHGFLAHIPYYFWR
jgi:hypothetical protein